MLKRRMNCSNYFLICKCKGVQGRAFFDSKYCILSSINTKTFRIFVFLKRTYIHATRLPNLHTHTIPNRVWKGQGRIKQQTTFHNASTVVKHAVNFQLFFFCYKKWQIWLSDSQAVKLRKCFSFIKTQSCSKNMFMQP